MKKQATLLEETRESAIAVLEDIRHLGSVVAKAETQAVDLRHASAILRRLLVEGTLRRVANPRIGKIELSAIDNMRVLVDLLQHHHIRIVASDDVCDSERVVSTVDAADALVDVVGEKSEAHVN